MRETRSLRNQPPVKNHAAWQNRHQHYFAALAQPGSADPKFRLIGVSSARRDYARDAVTQEAAPLKLENHSPANRHQHRLLLH
jgi:hypothetical protein